MATGLLLMADHVEHSTLESIDSSELAHTAHLQGYDNHQHLPRLSSINGFL
jgi:hypothetical protein